MRFGQSDLASCTPTWARPLATSTDIVSRQVSLRDQLLQNEDHVECQGRRALGRCLRPWGGGWQAAGGTSTTTGRGNEDEAGDDEEEEDGGGTSTTAEQLMHDRDGDSEWRREGTK